MERLEKIDHIPDLIVFNDVGDTGHIGGRNAAADAPKEVNWPAATAIDTLSQVVRADSRAPAIIAKIDLRPKSLWQPIHGKF